jgi:mono/diheme cytochrome c family protein
MRALHRRGLLLALALLAPCEDEGPAPFPVIGGDAERGQALIASHGCAGCHAIPGITPSVGTVGPPRARGGPGREQRVVKK